MALNPQYEEIGRGFVQQYYALFDDPAQRPNLVNMYNVSVRADFAVKLPARGHCFLVLDWKFVYDVRGGTVAGVGEDYGKVNSECAFFCKFIALVCLMSDFDCRVYRFKKLIE